MNLVLNRSGLKGTSSSTARSFAGYGQRLSGPKVGAIAVLSPRQERRACGNRDGSQSRRKSHAAFGQSQQPRCRGKLSAQPRHRLCLADELSGKLNDEYYAPAFPACGCVFPSCAGKIGTALFHEGAAALLIIAARETALDHFGAARKIARRLVLRQFTDDKFCRCDGERCIGGNRIRIAPRECFDFAVRNDTIDKSHEHSPRRHRTDVR
jgi:hypothetical protein